MNTIEQTLEESGAAVTDIRDKKTGKLLVNNRTPRNRYYTPDGREQLKIPQRRERSDGVVYDLFLAQGYTLTPPANPKLYCKGCEGGMTHKGKLMPAWERKGNLQTQCRKGQNVSWGKNKEARTKQ